AGALRRQAAQLDRCSSRSGERQSATDVGAVTGRKCGEVWNQSAERWRRGCGHGSGRKRKLAYRNLRYRAGFRLIGRSSGTRSRQSGQPPPCAVRHGSATERVTARRLFRSRDGSATNMKLRAYLVDDEPLALTRLRRLLERSEHVEVIGS